MIRTTARRGLAFGLLASLFFGTSGVLVKPLLDAGWSPAAAVAVRAGLAGLVLLPVAIVAVRGRWRAVWRGRWRILGMALVGVAGTQLAYFAALQRIPVSSALLVEYLAPVLLVAWVALATRRLPRAIVVAGSVVALAGLVLVIGPVGGGDPVGYGFAALAAVGCAAYYVVAARPADGLPAVALASGGLLLGSAALVAVGATGLVPVTVAGGEVAALGGVVSWWVPVLVLAVTTAIAYAASIAASQRLGSRLMSFVGMLEVVVASVFAWALLDEALGLAHVLGGALILVGIALVRAERTPDAVVVITPPTAEAQDAAAAIIAPVDGVESTDPVARPAVVEPIAPVDPTEPIATVGGAPA